MKIAILNIHFGIVERGAEIWTENLSAELSQKHKIDIYSIGEKLNVNYRNIKINSVPFVTAGFFYHLSVFIFTLGFIFYLFRYKYDWVIPVNGRLQALLIRLFRPHFNYKIMIVGHAGIGREDKINLWLGIPDIFVALSKKAFAWAEKIKFHKTKTVYIPNGVDTDLFLPQGNKVNVGLKNPIILTVSELLPYKRIEKLIFAVKKIKKLSLLIIGKGILENQIDKLGIMNLGNRYKRIPFIPHQDLPKFYSSADLFSLPSYESEAFGLVYLEAVSSNLPVVAPDDENRRNLLGSSSVYTDVEDENKYAAAINKALNINFGTIPRNQSLKYSWKKIADRYEKILAEV